MCIAVKKYQHILSTNYYFPLFFDEENKEPKENNMTNPISASNMVVETTAATNTQANNEFQVDLIDLETLDSLIEEQQRNDAEEEEEVIQTQNDDIHRADGVVYVHRVELRHMLKMRTPEKISESFKNFYIAFKRADTHAVIRPFYKNDAYRISSINDSTQVQKPETLDMSRYHQGFRPNQRISLTGKMVLETKLTFEELKEKLEPWLQRNYYEISLPECQTEKLVTIGVLNHSSFTLNRNDLTASIKAMVQTQAKELQFEFSIQLDTWFCNAGNNGRVPMLFVSVERSKIQEGTAFFCKLYNGENSKVPLGHFLWFKPTYQIEITYEIRERIGQEQRSWRSAEVACYVYGFQDISTGVFSFPNGDPNSIRRTLFHGVDRDPRKHDWIFVKYHQEDSKLFRRRARRLAHDLAQLVEEGELTKIFRNPELGLEFGGEITKSYSAQSKKSRQPNPVNLRILHHFHSIVGKLQTATIKRPVVTPQAPRRNEPAQQTYASTASRAMYTSTTCTRDISNAENTNATQTATESVVVIEKYEQRFTSIENMCHDNATRISRVEVSTSTTANMVRRLLIHSGIPLDAEMDEATADTDHEGVNEGGTKRQCQSQQTSMTSQSGAQNSNRY